MNVLPHFFFGGVGGDGFSAVFSVVVAAVLGLVTPAGATGLASTAADAAGLPAGLIETGLASLAAASAAAADFSETGAFEVVTASG
ncbi:MAG: hypothetical protein ABJB12_06645 [Pseudomonadota bacterium]